MIPLNNIGEFLILLGLSTLLAMFVMSLIFLAIAGKILYMLLFTPIILIFVGLKLADKGEDYDSIKR